MFSEVELIRELRIRASLLSAEATLDDTPVDRPQILIEGALLKKLLSAAKDTMSPCFIGQAVKVEARADAGFAEILVGPDLLIHVVDIAAPALDRSDVTMQF